MFCINIAGISVYEQSETFYHFYNGFLGCSKNDPDIKVTLNATSDIDRFRGIFLKYSQKSTLLFDSSSLWKIFKYNDSNLITAYHQNKSLPARCIIASNKFSRLEILLPKDSIFNFPDKNILEYPLDEIIYISHLPDKNGCLFHSAGIQIDNHGAVFLGKSGAGKSTISKLFNANRIHVLNDDRTILRKLKSEIYVFGTPWHGDAKLYSNKSAPLKKIFFLKHGKKNEIKLINPTQAAALLVARSFPPYWDAEGMQNVLALCTEIAQTIPCYEFSFVPDKSAVDFILNL